MVPRDRREAYRQWAKDNFKAQMDERAWVHESDWQDFLLDANETEFQLRDEED